ncbi:MAG: hypothetical protein IKZ49_04220 [Alphaproteobacteria bacterium]|nr:hypothetical protein [Alphaproteobacteria bacterium]
MKKILFFVLLAGCVANNNFVMREDFAFKPIQTKNYEIATWQKINNPKNNDIHIYIEGDGHAFDSYGQPTSDPTPHGYFMRQMAINDEFENVVYIARPCQFIMDKNCSESDWTNGRFSQKVIDSMSSVVKEIGHNKKISLIGYSGGALVSGLVIQQNPKLKFENWITIAGVLDHEEWTKYFNDAPLDKSLNLTKLPNIKQKHFVGGRDEIVPYELSKKWVAKQNLILIDDATHNDFGNLKIF